MTKYICDGMEYNFSVNGELHNNYGTLVAKLEIANIQDEYHYFIDIQTNEVMHSMHENFADDMYTLGRILVEQYTVFNS